MKTGQGLRPHGLSQSANEQARTSVLIVCAHGSKSRCLDCSEIALMVAHSDSAHSSVYDLYEAWPWQWVAEHAKSLQKCISVTMSVGMAFLYIYSGSHLPSRSGDALFSDLSTALSTKTEKSLCQTLPAVL